MLSYFYYGYLLWLGLKYADWGWMVFHYGYRGTRLLLRAWPSKAEPITEDWVVVDRIENES